MQEEIRLLVLGDICSTPDYRSLFDSNDPAVLMHNLVPLLKTSDFCIANLEAPAIEKPSPIVKCGPVLSMRPSDLDLLKKAGIQLLSLANNHIRDHGDMGVLSTLRLCKEKGIHTLGAGKDKLGAAKPYSFSVKGKTIAILACAEKEFNVATAAEAGANPYHPLETISQIREVKEKCDFLLLLYHGGIEYHPYPSPELQQRCRMMSLAGADFVICQHSHCIGTVEQFNGATIVYGQGNAIYGYREEQKCWNEGLAIQITIAQESFTASFMPLQAKPDGVYLLQPEEAQKRIAALMLQSRVLDDEISIRQKWDEFCDRNKALYLPLALGRSRVFNKLNRILGNRPIECLYSKTELMVLKNLIQCEAHREVLLNILERNSEAGRMR